MNVIGCVKCMRELSSSQFDLGSSLCMVCLAAVNRHEASTVKRKESSLGRSAKIRTVKRRGLSHIVRKLKTYHCVTCSSTFGFYDGKSSTRCPECQSRYGVIMRKRKRRLRKRLLVAQRGGRCEMCGATPRNMELFHFHHRDPLGKVSDVSKMIKSASMNRLQAEVDKCDLLCRDCHMGHHVLDRKGKTEK
jgi:DNA-directed RNA polymerase subunit RPC12/RpoP